MEEKEVLTSEQRLAIIEQMINTAQGKIMDNSFHFLLWGWVVALANLGHFYLMSYTNYSNPEIVWLVCLPAGIVSGIYGYKQGKKAISRSYIDRISMWIWLVFIFGLVTVIFFGAKINFMVNPMIMLLTGMATFLSGITIKFKPLIIGGIVFWLACVLGFMSSMENQTLIAAMAITLGYIIPGYLLKSQRKNG